MSLFLRVPISAAEAREPQEEAADYHADSGHEGSLAARDFARTGARMPAVQESRAEREEHDRDDRAQHRPRAEERGRPEVAHRSES